MDVTLWIVICLFASFGLVQALGWVICLMSKPKKRVRGYYVLHLPKEPAELESQLRYGLLSRKWNGGMLDTCLLLVDDGLGQECQEICERMIDGVYGVLICTPESLSRIISDFCDLQTEEQQI